RPKPTITYHYNGGTPPASPNPTNYVVGVGCTVNNEPTRLGYPFAGWTCPELGISSTSPAPFIVPTTATADLNLQANWSAATPYNITYITNGGSTPLSASSYTVATPDITLDAPIKAGHTFIGWTGTDIAGPFPQRDVIIPQGSTGDRAYNAHWSFQFAADTVYACNPPVALQSGHDGQSYLWTLPDGSTHTGADIQAHTTGKYILATDYGALSVITKDTVFVLFSFDGDLKIKRISEAGTKINLPQTFTVPLNPEIVAVADNIDWEWSFPGGSPLTSTADDTVSVAYAATGPKTVSVRIRIERSGQICEQTYTYDFEIHASVRGLFVDCHVAGGTEDGSSWPNAFRTIQEALADASEGDFIWVARGDYRAEAGQSFVLTRDSVEIYGGFAATETYLHERSYASNPTTVRGNGSSVIYTEGVSSASRWDGFIVEGGEAAKGGGITNKNSSVTIANTIIRGNTADHGGGIFSDGGSPVLYNVEISGNTSVDGGGMYNLASAPQLTHVTIAGNYAASSGGGICNRNGSNPALRNTIVWGNRSTAGPGVGNDGASVPYIASSLVEGSRAGGAWNAAVGTDGGNNLDASPGFRKKGFDDDGHMQQGAYRLYSFSPAIDRGANKYAFYTPIRLNVHLQTQQDTATVSAITGNDLAGYARMENDVVDMGAYEYFAEYDTDGKEIVREVAIPRVEGITTMPPAGRHFIQSQRDFVFTIIPNPDYSLDNLSVTTGIPLRDREGIVMERNEDGSITVIIRQVTEPISLTIQGATPTSADADAEHDRVWSHGKYLYVRADHDAELQIRTPAGILYTNRKVAAGDTAIMLPQGFYIVTLDGKMYKVVIK
ncbi:MAG: InlB B-repeat-containing protein, partial [Tannerella sp.]|nr:InlB B-repeat-containing protein [Tannerella sp.]